MTTKSKLSDLFKGYFSAKTREEKEGYLRQIHLLINRDYFLDEKYLNSYMEVNFFKLNTLLMI